MKGIEVKSKLIASGYKLSDIAKKMGIIPQTFQSFLRSDDMKVGVLQEIVKAIDKDLSFFFEEDTKNDNNNLQETQLVSEITKNSRKAYFLYQRIVDIDILLEEQIGVKKKGGYAVDEAKIINDTFFKKYDFVVDEMSFEQRTNFNSQLKSAIETLSDIFFERFKTLYTELRKKPTRY